MLEISHKNLDIYKDISTIIQIPTISCENTFLFFAYKQTKQRS